MTGVDSANPPLFTIEHHLEIPATADEVWGVLVDFSAYATWNPYVLAISGDLAAGSSLSVTIAQANWPRPLTIGPRLIRVERNRVLHWRGQIGDGGVLDTDHSFHIDPLSSERLRFAQREEFRGTLAETMEADARKFTHDAFRAMNEALASRVLASKS